MGLILGTNALLNQLDYANLDTNEQAQVNALIEVASDLIEKYCNRTFLADDYTELIDGTGQNQIFVQNPPINSIDTITFKADEDTEVAGDQFDFYGELGEIRWKQFNLTSSSGYEGIFPVGQRNIQIVYNGGFTEVPTPIQLACADMVTEAYDPTINSKDIESEKLGQYFIKFGTGKLSSSLLRHKQILNMYKIRFISSRQ